MGTHQVLWMALDHKYGSWFDYMEPHVKPTTPAQPFPPPTPSLFNPTSSTGLGSHASANVAALHAPLANPPLPFTLTEMRRRIEVSFIFLFSATYAQSNKVVERDAIDLHRARILRTLSFVPRK